MIEGVNLRAQRLNMLKAMALVLAFCVPGLLIGAVLASPDWKMAITVAGLVTYVAVVLVNPTAGFLLWVATAPFARFLYLNISLGRGIPDLSLDRIVSAFTFVLLMAQLAIRKRHMARLTVVDLFMVLFLLGAGLSLPQAMAGTTATIQAFFDTQVVPLLVYLMAKNLINNRSAHRAFVFTLLFMGAYLSALVIHEQLTGIILFYPEGRTLQYTAHIRRVVGLLGNPAFFAMILGMILPFAWRALLQARTRWGGLIRLALVGAMVWAIYLCYNRAGWLAALLAMLFMALFYPRFRKLFMPLLLLAGIVTALSWGQLSQSYVISERLTAQAPVDYRFNAIDVALRMVSSNPVFGRGYGNFGYLYARYATDWTQTRVLPAPHNTYINILVSAGLAGFVPFVGLFLAILGHGLRLWKLGGRNLAIDRSLLVCMVGSLLVYTSTIFFSDIVAVPYVTSVFFCIVGGVLGYQERVLHVWEPREGAA